MNIAVSPKALEFHQAHKARREMWNKQAAKPRLIDPPKVQLAEILKKRKIAKPVFKVWSFTNHIKAYYLHQSSIDDGIEIPADVAPAAYPSIEKIQEYCLKQTWSDSKTLVDADMFLKLDLKSDRRALKLVLVRHAAFYLCAKLTPRSYPEIGREFGGKDHTSVLHGAGRIQARIEDNELLMNGKPFNLDRIGEI